MVEQREVIAQSVGGLFGWFWESPEVTACEGERFACLLQPAIEPLAIRKPIFRSTQGLLPICQIGALCHARPSFSSARSWSVRTINRVCSSRRECSRSRDARAVIAKTLSYRMPDATNQPISAHATVSENTNRQSWLSPSGDYNWMGYSRM